MKDFKPVLRFVVASDVHILAENEAPVGEVVASTPEERKTARENLAALFDTAYSYAEKSQGYKKLDAVIFAGDFTDDGSPSQYEDFFSVVNPRVREETKLLTCIGNHAWYFTGESPVKNNDNTKTYGYFRHYTGHDVDTVETIGGCYFIGCSMDIQGGRGFSPEKGKWLRDRISEAVAADPSKPVFVYQHLAPSRSVYGSSGTSVTKYYTMIELEKALDGFPQVVDFCGHSHRLTDDPSSIVRRTDSDGKQGCTVVATGTMAYSEAEMYYADGSIAGVLPTDRAGGYHTTEGGDYYNEYNDKDASQYTIVEVDAGNRVKIQRYDINSRSFLNDAYFVGESDVKSCRVHDVPVWSSDACIGISEVHSQSARLLFPQASCKDTVRNYRCELFSNGNLTDTVYRLSDSFMRPVPDVLELPFSGLKECTSYEVKIYPVSGYGVEGKPLCGLFSTVPYTGDPDIFSLEFENEDAYNVVSGEKLGKAKSGDDSVFYEWDKMTGYYSLMEKGFTLKTRFELTSRGECALVSDRRHGGFGLWVDEEGYIVFSVFTSKSRWVNVRGVAAKGVVEAKGVFDGKTARLYINGKPAGSREALGILWAPLKSSTRYLVIGGDCGLSHISRLPVNGKVYSAELSACVCD